jgi:hypothetical protein
MSRETVRTTFVLPAETAKKLKEFIPDRKRSEFVAKAIEQYLMGVTYQQALELSFGKWKDDDYPHLRTQEDMERFICEMRSDESWRLDQEKEK